jgi:hypothetical protein
MKLLIMLILSNLSFTKSLGIIKDISTIVATTVAAFVAIKGLDAWKKQKKWQIEYDSSRNLYKAVLQVRDAISYVRDPFILLAEMDHAITELKERTPSKEQVDTNRAVYRLRWNKIVSAMSSMQLELLEAEVLWENVKETVKPLERCVAKLNNGVSQLLDPQLRINKTDFYDIIYEGGEDNVFTKEIENAVKNVTDFLKPKLKV